jgi:hypothetical protein
MTDSIGIDPSPIRRKQVYPSIKSCLEYEEENEEESFTWFLFIVSRHIPFNPCILSRFFIEEYTSVFHFNSSQQIFWYSPFKPSYLFTAAYCWRILLLRSLSFRKMVIGASISDRWIDTIGWNWIDGSMVIGLTRILWSMIDTIDQKEKSLTDGSILSVVSIESIGIDPSPIVPIYALRKKA